MDPKRIRCYYGRTAIICSDMDLDQNSFSTAMYIRTVNKDWNKLMSDPNIRCLMSYVPQNMNNNEFDHKNAQVIISEKIESSDNSRTMKGQCRRNIILFLNDIFFCGVSLLPKIWWFEMHLRMKKLILISLVLERENLISIGGTPSIMDIPQPLIHISCHMKNIGEYFILLTKLHKDLCDKNVPEIANVYVVSEKDLE